MIEYITLLQMWQTRFTESELNDLSKKSIESLEYWLRNLINDQLSKKYGRQFYSFQTTDGQFLIKKRIREETAKRIDSSPPDRFSRWIESTVFDHLIDIICNPSIYDSTFKRVFSRQFEFGASQIKQLLEIIHDVRNRLYHLNPVSSRKVEQSICYSNDLIYCIRDYYIERNMHMDFNAPSILKYSDSLGHQFFYEQGTKTAVGWLIYNRFSVRCGDILTIEIEVDASFSPDEYTIDWFIRNYDTVPFKNSTKAVITFAELHVSESFQISVQVKSNKSWHRHSLFDDILEISLPVLPPI